MPIFGKKFPGPIAQPLAPFFVAGVVILYGVNSFAEALKSSENFSHDPRIPKQKAPKPT